MKPNGFFVVLAAIGLLAIYTVLTAVFVLVTAGSWILRPVLRLFGRKPESDLIEELEL